MTGTRATAILALLALLLSAGALPYLHTCHPPAARPLGFQAEDAPASAHSTHAACSACALGCAVRVSIPGETTVVGPPRHTPLLARRLTRHLPAEHESASAEPRAPPAAS
jgi:anaerobic selenocysteine-containing dehydrogenase